MEYRSFAGNRSRYAIEQVILNKSYLFQFIELFDSDLVVLPKNLPEWFTMRC